MMKRKISWSRVLAVLLALVLTVGLFPVGTARATGNEDGGMTLPVEDGTGTVIQAEVDEDEGSTTVDPTVGTNHPSTAHLGSCTYNENGYTCPYGSTLQFKIAPRLGSNNVSAISFDGATDITVCIDDDPHLTKTVKYTSGEVNVTLKGILPGTHKISVTGVDAGKYEFTSTSFDAVENWFTRKDNNGNTITLSGNTIGTNGSITFPAASANPEKLYLDNLSVWVFPHYVEQTTTVTASVDIDGYESAERDAKTYDLQICDKDGVAITGQSIQTANKANGWSVSWKDMPYGTYKVRNQTLKEIADGPDAKFADIKPTDDIQIIASVTFPGVASKDIPSSVKLELVNSDGKVVDTQDVGRITTPKAWQYVWTVERGDYTVREKVVPDGMAVTYDSEVKMGRNTVEWSVINSLADSKTVYLTWNGFGTSYPVQSVQIALKNSSGATVKTETLNSSNSWSVSWTDLDPDEYYTVEELTTGAWTARVTRTSTGWSIVNSATMSVTATLTWSGYSDGNYPVDTVYVQLVNGNGRNVGSQVALTASRGWRYTWNDLEVDDYTVYEVTTGSWKADYKITGGASGSSGSGSSASKNVTVAITNTKTNTASVTVKVVWSGFGTDAEPVDYVRMVLKDESGEQVGSAVQVKSSASWSYTWKDLPAGDYTVEQTTTGNWKTTYKQSGTAWTVTNTKTDTLSVTAKVTWSGYSNESDHPDTVMLKLTQTNAAAGSAGAAGYLGTATKANNWTYTWTDLEDGGVYSLEEVTTGDWTPEYSKTSSNGKTEVWTVKNTKSSGSSGTSASGSTSLNVTMLWSGYTAPPVSSVTVQVMDGSTVVKSQAMSGSGNIWTYTFTGLDASKAYSVKEVVPDGGGWTYTPQSGGTGAYTLINSPVTPTTGGDPLGPTGTGTSAAGGDIGPTGTGTSAAGSTTYSNPPKTGDMTWLVLLMTAAMAGVTGVLAYRRRRLFR